MTDEQSACSTANPQSPKAADSETQNIPQEPDKFDEVPAYPPKTKPASDVSGGSCVNAVYDPSGFYAHAYQKAANEVISAPTTPEPPAGKITKAYTSTPFHIPGLSMFNTGTKAQADGDIRFSGRNVRKVGHGNTGAFLVDAPSPNTTYELRHRTPRPKNNHSTFPAEVYEADNMDVDGFSDIEVDDRNISLSRGPDPPSEGPFYRSQRYEASNTPPSGLMALRGNRETPTSTSKIKRSVHTEAGPSREYLSQSGPAYRYRDEASNSDERSASEYGYRGQGQAQLNRGYRIPKYSDRARGSANEAVYLGPAPKQRRGADDDEYDLENLGLRHSGRAQASESEFELAASQYSDNDNDDLFVNQPGTVGRRIKKSRHEEKGKENVRFSAGTYAKLPQPEPEQGINTSFINHGEKLNLSRFSGVTMPWGVNRVPDMMDQEDVPDAALLKRGIKRPRNTDKVCPRGYGANDPENIEIVNLKENEGIGFPRIAQILNERRLHTGKSPTLSATGVANRYNRTAPLLFAAEGKQFIPLSQRKKGTMTESKIMWTSARDTALVAAVKEYEAGKWKAIATIFNRMTGLNTDDRSVAVRYNVL